MSSVSGYADWEDEKIRLASENWETIAPGVEIFRLPSGEPVRRIITGRRSVKVGGFYSHKNGRHVVHESDGEEWCARVLEVHSDVRSFSGQPETLRIKVDGKPRPQRYTPDFLADIGGMDVRIEFKWWADLWPPKAVGNDSRAHWRWLKAIVVRQRLRNARDAYRRVGMLMAVITERELQEMADKATVDEIVANAGRPIGHGDRDRLLEHLRAHRVSSIRDCEATLRESEFPRGDILSRIPERLIQIDLRAPISPETLVTLVED
jgi:hypothetical protein